MTEQQQIRKIARKLLPSWLQDGDGEKVVYLLAATKDGRLEWETEAVAARWPEYAPDDALPKLGRERRILRGPDEARASYETRLKGWIPAHKRRGHAFGILEQLDGYLQPHVCRFRLITNTGMWYTRDSDDSESWLRANPTNWDWDGSSSSWWRFWVIIYPPADGSLWARTKWGQGNWGSGGTLGSTATREQVQTIRSLVREWMPAHAMCMNIIIAFDWSDFAPTAAPGAPMPDGTWGDWLKHGTDPAVQSRDLDAIYWDGASL